MQEHCALIAEGELETAMQRIGKLERKVEAYKVCVSKQEKKTYEEKITCESRIQHLKEELRSVYESHIQDLEKALQEREDSRIKDEENATALKYLKTKLESLILQFELRNETT